MNKTSEQRTVSALVALKDMGFDTSKPCTGSVIVQTGAMPLKRYRFRYRVGDGHVLFRWGRLVSARKQILTGLWIFEKAPS